MHLAERWIIAETPFAAHESRAVGREVSSTAAVRLLSLVHYAAFIGARVKVCWATTGRLTVIRRADGEPCDRWDSADADALCATGRHRSTVLNWRNNRATGPDRYRLTHVYWKRRFGSEAGWVVGTQWGSDRTGIWRDAAGAPRRDVLSTHLGADHSAGS